ncbi:hypothetical protein BCV69DRAFT_282953 [Microstroma glucosiphilum]|uniref:Eukaryotic translation initiation factor 3 subunit A n=1 Tax=Pseudomicrostroma glucosiphilum TaxID=1684307 RepID=A0A316U691_9BASI|nr:hypothetical protein BCV69DRAFT_282953 [Pseudomicrostroma glucosiphilum]PWN20732.1 hypothetical protein BCV69DRAFT_282953 [Pseudomicrostroma glucosiphilum]
MNRIAKPETILKRSEELVNVGQSPAALAALGEVITSRKFKTTPLTSLEPIMMRFVELCVELRRGRTAKDGLLQYKNISQNTNPQSIENVIKHFIKLSETRVTDAQSKAEAAAADLDVDDLEESETPEGMLLGAVTSEENKDRADRALVTPTLKFLWEAYRTALDILRNNARLEVPYQQLVHQVLKFCLQYKRKTEFRRLCDLLRTHLQNVSRLAHHTHAINLNDPDTLQRHLDTRFAQLNASVELELWQEAFRSVEDVHSLLTMAKKAPRPSMMANYYEKLSKIFLVSDNNLFHAAARSRFYALARGGIKTEEEHRRLASLVLLSSLAVPVISSNAPGTGNIGKSKTDFLMGDQESLSRTGRLTSLLGLSRTPTRAGLVKEALSRNILKRVQPEIRQLYDILEVEFHPLSICEKIEPIMAKIAEDEEMSRYIKPLHSVILTRLFQQLSQVYDAVKLDRVMELVSAFKAPYNYTREEIEKFCLNAAKRGHLSIRVDHVSQAIAFQEDVFNAPYHPAATISGDQDSVRLQATPGELVRTQLTRLATCLDTTMRTIDPSIVENAQKAKAEVFARAVVVAESEHKAALARKLILARHKELLQERARDEAKAEAERARLLAESEQKRLAEETRKKEQDRIRKELDAVRAEETRKMAQSLREKGGIKLTEEEYANLDTEKLVQLQVSQIEKEKKDLAERLRVIFRRMDHLERAYRREELPLLDKDYDRQKEEDLASHKQARIVAVQTAREKHQADLEAKKRLGRIMPDYTVLKKSIEGKRAQELAEKREQAAKKIEAAKQQRKKEVAQAREERRKREEEDKKRQAEEAELARLREEEEARAEEQRKMEADKRAEQEAEKRAEIEARQAKLREQGEKQRQRELEIEQKLKAQSSSGPTRAAAPAAEAAAPTTGDSTWRRAPAGAVASARTASPSAAPSGERPSLFGAKSGGWRDRLTAKQAGGAAVEDGAQGAASPTPAPSRPAAASPAPAPAAPSPAAPSASENRFKAGGAPVINPGAGWRERQAAREQQGGAAAGPQRTPASPAAAAPREAAAGANADGFQEVKKTTGAYRPPGRR